MSKSRVLICRVATAAAFSAAAAGCSDDGSGGNGGNGGGGNDAAPAVPTLTELYTNVLARNCAGPACHSSALGGGLIIMSPASAHAALVNQPAGAGYPCEGSGLMRVVPGDPEASLLYQKVTNTHSCGDPMPIAGMLEASEIESIRLWIEADAPNN